MDNQENFEKNMKATLEKSMEQLTPDVTRRLQLARYAALEKVKPRRSWLLFPQLATAMLTVSIISVSLFFNFNVNNEVGDIVEMESEMEMLTSNDNLELMEDLEFIQWLVETDKYAS